LPLSKICISMDRKKELIRCDEEANFLKTNLEKN
jgi:hypothetical protein